MAGGARSEAVKGAFLAGPATTYVGLLVAMPLGILVFGPKLSPPQANGFSDRDERK